MEKKIKLIFLGLRDIVINFDHYKDATMPLNP